MSGRRTFLKRVGQATAGATIGVGGFTGQAVAACSDETADLTKGDEFNKGTKYGNRTCDRVEACDTNGTRDLWADFNWGIGWVRQSDEKYRFVVSGVYHTYSSDQCSASDFDVQGAQNQVKLDAYLTDTDSSSLSTISAFDNQTSIIGYNVNEWRDWKSQEAGVTYDQQDITSEYESQNFQDDDTSLFVDVASYGAGVAATATGAGVIGLGGASLVIGGLLLAQDLAQASQDCGVEEANNEQEFYRWWDFCDEISLSSFVCEFDVFVDEPALTLEVFQSVGHDSINSLDNVGYWTIDIPRGGTPSLIEKGFYEKDGGHQYHYGSL